MMRHYFSSGLVLLMIPLTWAQGADEQDSLPKLKSPAAKQAINAYQKAIADVQAEADKKAAAAKQELLKVLAATQEAATKAGQLDEALLIRGLRETMADPAFTGKPAKGGVQVLAALYGANTSWLDVTDKVRKMVEGRKQTPVPANNATLGDFHPGYTGTATLVVRYAVGGQIKIKSVNRGESLTLP